MKCEIVIDWSLVTAFLSCIAAIASGRAATRTVKILRQEVKAKTRAQRVRTYIEWRRVCTSGMTSGQMTTILVEVWLVFAHLPQVREVFEEWFKNGTGTVMMPGLRTKLVEALGAHLKIPACLLKED